jgi:hypothetical protein
MLWNEDAPIVVGGLGGSGTRVIAQLMRESGIYIGNYLNEPLDNLWFTLLFRRPKTIINPDNEDLLPLVNIFHKRMSGNYKWNLSEQKILWSCAYEFIKCNYVKSKRFSFPIKTLRSFYKDYFIPSRLPWGWKEPNSHIFLELLIKQYSNLKYIHVIRHPLDAVYGSNQLQIQNWKHLFRIEEGDRRHEMLLYYQAANRHAITIAKRLGERFMLIRLEDLCSDSEYWINRLLAFWNIEPNEDLLERLYKIPNKERVYPKYLNKDYSDVHQLASSVAEEFGYAKSFALNG